MSDDECLRADWYQVGKVDGAHGHDMRRLSGHAEACADVGVVPDATLWEAGRAAGLTLYCTPQNAYDVGLDGHRLNNVCDPADQARLIKANERGLYLHQLDEEIRRLDGDIGQKEREIASLREEIATLREQKASRPEIRMRRARVRLLRDQIRAHEFELIRLRDERLEALSYGYRG